MSIPQKLFRGSVAQSIQIIVNIVIGLFMLPFMMSQLGESLYGIWILIGGLTASLYLFDFGFASAVIRSMAHHISRGDDESSNRTVNSALVVYTCLGFLVMAATVIICWVSDRWVDNPQNVEIVRLLILIGGCTLAIEFPFKAFAGISGAYVRYDLSAWSRIAIRLVMTGMTIWALLSGYKLVALAILQFGGSLIGNVVFFLIARHLHKPLRISWAYVNKKTMKILLNYSVWTFVMDLSQIAKNKAPIFFVAAYLGPSALAVYYVAVRLGDFALQLLTRATNMSTPVLAGYQAKGDMNAFRDKLIVFVRINFLMGLFAVYGFFFLGEPFIRIWMGPDFAYHQVYIAGVVIISGQMAAYIFAPLGSALMAISRHRWQAIINICEVAGATALIFIGLDFLKTGLIGTAIGVALPLLIGRLVFLPWAVSREIKLSVWCLYRQLIKPAILIATAYGLSFVVLYNADIESLKSLILYCFIISFIYWPLALLALSRKEWGYLIKMLPDKLGAPLWRRFSTASTIK
jgi:O-antigen/teichoic acid export membrane protein